MSQFLENRDHGFSFGYREKKCAKHLHIVAQFVYAYMPLLCNPAQSLRSRDCNQIRRDEDLVYG